METIIMGYIGIKKIGNGNYHNGLYRDNGKEHRTDYNGLYRDDVKWKWKLP